MSRENSGIEQYNGLRTQYDNLQQQYTFIKTKQDAATMKLLESQSKWTSFAKDILAISKELYKAIHTLQTHGTIPREFLEMTAARMQKYEIFLNENETTFKHKIVEEEAKQSALPEVDEEMESTPTAVATTANKSTKPLKIRPNFAPAALDHTKIKQFLRTSRNDLKICALLQALKWRLIKAPKGQSRKQSLQWLLTFDLLGCNNAKDDLLERLLKHPNRKYVHKV